MRFYLFFQTRIMQKMITFCSFLLLSLFTYGTDTGFQSPTAAGAVNNDWGNTTNAYSSDNSDADVVDNNDMQDWYNFGFSIPSDAWITGIEVQIEAEDPTDNGANSGGVRLSWDGATTYSVPKKFWGGDASDRISTLGDSSNLWNRSWTPGEFSDANFRLKITKLGVNGNKLNVDHIQVKVYYSQFESPSATGDDYNQWSNPANAYTSNDSRASELSRDEKQDWYNFGFDVPNGVAIDGIEAKLEYISSDGSEFVEGQIELSWNGGANYTSSGKEIGTSSTTDVTTTHGGSADTWGRSWTQTELSNANFRFRINNKGDGKGFLVDHIQIKIYYEGIALPIELLDFDAKLNEGCIDVSWETASEINNDYFKVERSRDAVNFEEVAIVNGAGNSSIRMVYAISDCDPYEGVSYYRLKQTDFDGTFTHSGAIWINNTATIYDAMDVSVFPNPSDGQSIRIDYKNSATKGGRLIFEMHQFNGQMVYQKVLEQEEVEISVVVDSIANLPPGLYFIVGKTDREQLFHEKVVIFNQGKFWREMLEAEKERAHVQDAYEKDAHVQE